MAERMSHLDEDLDEDLDAETDEPFDGLRVTSQLVDLELHQALDEAADNLLDKALRDLADGNLDRAQGYIEKAARLPVSSLLDLPAGQASAHLTLFTVIADDAESAKPGDSTWLDQALDVLDRCGELAALDLKATLQALAQDYGPNRVERKQIRAAIGGQDHAQALTILLENGQASVADFIRQNLEAVLLYESLG